MSGDRRPSEEELQAAGAALLEREPGANGAVATPTYVAPAVDGPAWPAPLAEAAFHGLAGDVVRAIEPQTEADPAAVLVQFQAAVANAWGPNPGFLVEADRHQLNLFVAIVGDSARGRKGTAWGQARRPVAAAADDAWSEREMGGLSSGEGLIWQVRDPTIERIEVADDADDADDGEQEPREKVTDPGAEDKRLLVYESELASVLARMKQNGNSLSALIRQAWDCKTLNTLVKHSPAKATGAHISLIGHITADELRRELTATDVANGFANRFLWVCARRSKLLPHGGGTIDWGTIPRRLSDALTFARSGAVGTLDWDAEARAVWEVEYVRLTEGAPGLLGAVTNRSDPQTRRLAAIYAVLDRAPEIRLEHLQAALAVWDYCESSCRYLFGEALGDPSADQALAALRRSPNGLSRTELGRALGGGHRGKGELERALAVLEREGLARMESRATGGRSEERWHGC